MIKESKFSRTLWNEAKYGAYFTDQNHCARIGQLFSFVEETCFLEPATGDGSAMYAFLNAAQKLVNPCKFGVEISKKSYDTVKTQFDYCINADFLKGTSITNKAFSFCFTNPPYGQIGEDGRDRLETRFCERIFNLMKSNGYMVLIVSYSTLQIDSFTKSLLARFSCEKIYRFDDDIYARFKQVVFIGKRRSSIGVLKHKHDEFLEHIKDSSSLPYLPLQGEYDEDLLIVPGSKESDIELFTTREFHPESVGENLDRSKLYSIMENALFQAPHQLLNINQPILPLKKDLLYLCAVAGGGQGIAGSEDRKDVHLQRGTAKRVENSVIEENEDEDESVEVVRSFTRIILTLIDNFGNVLELQ